MYEIGDDLPALVQIGTPSLGSESRLDRNGQIGPRLDAARLMSYSLRIISQAVLGCGR